MKVDSIYIESKSDGIYLVIDLRENDDLILYEDVMIFLKSYGVEDFNPQAVKQCIEQAERGKRVIMKITSWIAALQLEEALHVNFSEDYMEAYIIFDTDHEKNKALTFEKVLTTVMNTGILYGLDSKALRDAFNNRNNDEKFVVAKGKKPVPGQDGFVKYLFDTGEKKPVPEILENGRVDFHKLNLFEMADKDQVLAQLIPPTDGVNGIDVFAKEVAFKPGKPAYLPKTLHNVYTSGDGKTLCAAVPGQIVFKNNQISIMEVLVIQGDVDHSTGDIQFLGSVCIYGGIKTKFSVEAEGNVEIHGVVEGGHIKSSGNILLYGGLQGQNISNIHASGNLSSRYIMNSTIFAGGNLSSGYILHSNVYCGGFLEVNSTNATLVGGHIVAKKSIVSSVIGSPSATPTVLEVGVHPDKLKLYKKYRQELNKLQKELSCRAKLMENLEKKKAAKQSDKNQKAEFIRVAREILIIKNKIKDLKVMLNVLLPDLKNGQGKIIARKIIQPGVKIVIGNAALFIQKEIETAVLVKRDNKVQIYSGHF